MNNERFFEKSNNYGTLTEVLTMWFKSRPECEKIRSLKKYLPTIKIDKSLTSSKIQGSVLYTSEEINDKVLTDVKKLLKKEHPFNTKVEELYRKYNVELDNALDYCTDEEYAELLNTIDFKYSTIANLLLTADRRILRLTEIEVKFGVSVYEQKKDNAIYQFDKNNPSIIENVLTFDDFRIMMQN